MPRSPLAWTLATLALVAAPPAGAQGPSGRSWEGELAPTIAFLGGDTQYRIAAADRFSSVESELTFPVGGLAAGLQLEVSTRGAPEASRLVLQVSGLKSMAGPSGTLEDSDWISGEAELLEVGAPHDGKDIYSVSQAELDALVLEARVLWEPRPGRPLVLAPMAGILYQRFEYDVRDADQRGYGPWEYGYSGLVPGPVLEYRVSYRAPYVGGRAALTSGRVSATADLWFSPLASASDRDDHLARQKLATTDASGSAWQASVGGRLALGERDSLQAQASLVRFRATGTQHQRWYDGSGWEGEIDSTLTSSRWTAFVVWAHRLSR